MSHDPDLSTSRRKFLETSTAAALGGVLACGTSAPASSSTASNVETLSIGLIGLPLGLLVSVGAAFVSDYLDTSLHSPEEVWDVLSVPVLASLPATRELKLLN